MKTEEVQDVRVKKQVWRFSESLITYIVMLLLSGIHFGLIVLMNVYGTGIAVQILVPMIYWALMAAVFTVITKRQIKSTYDGPMKTLGKAAGEVADGDFSIYLKPRHTVDKLDYIDAMYLDFNKMVEALGGIETMKTDFFANVSHEMKAPLSVISSSLELMKSGKLTEEEYVRQLDNALAASRRMNDLIGNILKLNKLEKQTIVPKPETYELCGQLCECVLTFEMQMEEKGIEFEADLEDQAFICADADLMCIVWNNLISNAVKFTNTGGSITLRQRTENGQVIVSLSDTGCGMSKETIRHIFEKFYQGDTSHATEGNGLGLALVKQILDLMNGTISVDSREGEGSVFTVRISAAKEEPRGRAGMAGIGDGFEE